MTKLTYLFPDGTRFNTLVEAQEYSQNIKEKWVEDFVEISLHPERDVTDGVDFYHASVLRKTAGLKRIDVANVAKRGYYRSTEKDVLERTRKNNLWLKTSKEVN